MARLTETRLLLVAVAMLATSSIVGPMGDQTRPPRQDYSSGPYLYRTFCASCHGESGRGDGPVADFLRQRPTDLTTIAARNSGSFPRDRIFASIDGRPAVTGHGAREMPVWGDVLRVTEGQAEGTIKKRIDVLVTHLESIQVKGGI